MHPALYHPVHQALVGNIASGSVVYDATLVNGATVSNNQLLLSAASSQYMSIGNFTTGTAGLTFATWYKSDNSGNFARIFDFGNGQGVDNILIAQYGTQDKFAMHMSPGREFNQDASYKFNTGNVWKHVAWTLDPAGSGTWKVYIDGVLVGSTAGPYLASKLRSKNYIGKSNWADAYLNGGIKDFRMYNRVLSAAEVSTLFVTTVTASLSDGLQLGYRFDSVSGSRVGNIASGSVVYDATLVNGATVSNNQLLLSAASSQYMSIGNFTTGTAGLTFATWYKSDNNSGFYARIFDFGNGQATENIILHKEGTEDRVTLTVLNPGQPNQHFVQDASYKFNTGTVWKHVAWTLDPAGSGTWKFYIDGVLVASAVRLYPRSVLRSKNYLGKSNWANEAYLNGGIKDFRMYSRVLSAAEVNILFVTTNTN
eukprot:gene69330-biopygen21683